MDAELGDRCLFDHDRRDPSGGWIGQCSALLRISRRGFEDFGSVFIVTSLTAVL